MPASQTKDIHISKLLKATGRHAWMPPSTEIAEVTGGGMQQVSLGGRDSWFGTFDCRYTMKCRIMRAIWAVVYLTRKCLTQIRLYQQ